MTDSEARRASGVWSLLGEKGDVDASGEGDLLVTDDGLSFGPRVIEHLDADDLLARDWSIDIRLFPEGGVRLEMLGRRYETFAAALKEARQARRVEGMLAHGVDTPERFSGAVADPGVAVVELLLYPTHLAIAPERGDPWQIPLGAIRSIRHDERDWTIDVEARGTLFRFGQLARETEKFAARLQRACDASREFLGAPTGRPFADGSGIEASDLADFRELVDRWTAPERMAAVSAILGRAHDPHVGLVRILDTDGESLTAREPLPQGVAAFLLAPVDELVVLEIISGPSAATYLFAGDVDAVNADLQELHFRRRPLSLPSIDLTSSSSPYRLAARRLEPLRRLREAIRGRIVHDDAWAAKFDSSLQSR